MLQDGGERLLMVMLCYKGGFRWATGTNYQTRLLFLLSKGFVGKYELSDKITALRLSHGLAAATGQVRSSSLSTTTTTTLCSLSQTSTALFPPVDGRTVKTPSRHWAEQEGTIDLAPLGSAPPSPPSRKSRKKSIPCAETVA